MKRILSIDFDYFISTDLETRETKFPDGVDELPQAEIERQWNYFYNEYPEIADIPVINAFHVCCEELSKLRSGEVFIAESHKDIAKLFPLIDPEEDLEVINIDFHHDNYISGGSKVDCANWVRHLKDLFPKAQVKWIRREDSAVSSLTGEFPYEHTEAFYFKGEFDYIFLCFSPEWTPPHLRMYFRVLQTYVNHLTQH